MSRAQIRNAPRSARIGLSNDLRFRFAPRYRVVWIGLFALALLVLLSERSVYNQNSLILVSALAGILAIAAAGQLLVIVAGGIDLSVPAIMTLAAGVVVHQTDGNADALGNAVAAAVLLASLVGLVNGALVAIVRLNAMIVTLAMSGIVSGVIVWWMGPTFSDSGAVPESLADFAGKSVSVVSVVALMAVALLVLIATCLRSTRLGRRYVATGTNRTAAKILGVRVVAHEIGGYVCAAALYGVAGVMLAGMLTTPDATVGDPYQLTTIIAVALGGAALSGGPGSVAGTGAACLFVALLQQFLQAKGYSPGVSQIVNGAVLILAVALVTVSSGRLRLPRGVLARGQPQPPSAG